MKIVVVTCILNGWDNLHAPFDEARANSAAQYVCYTNVPHTPSVAPWEFRPAYLPLDSWGRNSRIPKILPDMFLDADFSIWHDGCFSLRKSPEQIVEETMHHQKLGTLWDIALFRHPSIRDDIFQEAEICIREKIGDVDAIARQATEYSRRGLMPHSGLWACGFLVRRHSEEMRNFNLRWWNAYMAGGDRDQIAFPFVARSSPGIRINTLEGDVWGNQYIAFHWHNAFKGRGDVDSFAAERAELCSKLDRLREVCGIDRRVMFSR